MLCRDIVVHKEHDEVYWGIVAFTTGEDILCFLFDRIMRDFFDSTTLGTRLPDLARGLRVECKPTDRESRGGKSNYITTPKAYTSPLSKWELRFGCAMASAYLINGTCKSPFSSQSKQCNILQAYPDCSLHR